MKLFKLNLGGFMANAKREATAAAWPAILAAVLGPMLVAVLPGLRGVAAEYLPPGPERLLMMAAVFALGAEIVRCHVLKFRLGRRLRAAEAETARLQIPKEEAPCAGC
jgi:hypothetical protein